MAQATKSRKPEIKKVAADAAAPIDAAANAALAGKAALAGTRAAGKAVTLAASRARMPLIAGGSAAAGLAGGLAVIHRRRDGKRTRRRR